MAQNCPALVLIAFTFTSLSPSEALSSHGKQMLTNVFVGTSGTVEKESSCLSLKKQLEEMRAELEKRASVEEENLALKSELRTMKKELEAVSPISHRRRFSFSTNLRRRRSSTNPRRRRSSTNPRRRSATVIPKLTRRTSTPTINHNLHVPTINHNVHVHTMRNAEQDRCAGQGCCACDATQGKEEPAMEERTDTDSDPSMDMTEKSMMELLNNQCKYKWQKDVQSPTPTDEKVADVATQVLPWFFPAAQGAQVSLDLAKVRIMADHMKWKPLMVQPIPKGDGIPNATQAGAQTSLAPGALLEHQDSRVTVDGSKICCDCWKKAVDESNGNMDTLRGKVCGSNSGKCHFLLALEGSDVGSGVGINSGNGALEERARVRVDEEVASDLDASVAGKCSNR